MLHRWIRLFYSDNGVLTDLSVANQSDTDTVRADLVKDQDYIYIFEQLPSNNFYVEIDTANDVAATLKIEYWNGRAWQEALDIVDATVAGGGTLAKSGVVQFSPNPNYKWNYVNDTSKSGAPTETATLNLFYMYPKRISASGTLKNTTKIKTLSYAFTTSQQLKKLCVEVDKFLPAFGVGKTNWNQEILTASLHVVHDLKAKGLITGVGNILMMDNVSLATDYKTLTIIYASLGPSQIEARNYFEKKYNETLNSQRYTFDQDEDAFIDKNEINNTIQKLVR